MEKQNQARKELIAGIWIKAIAIIASVYGIIRTQSGWYTFTFFTNLSNVWIDIVLLIFLVQDVVALLSGNEQIKKTRKNGYYIVKYVFTCSITLTFFAYLFILAPTNDCGFFMSYFRNGAGSFGVHFVAPVLAVIDYILYDYEYSSKKYHAIYATFPPILYVGFVAILSYGFGVRWYETMAAPYNFINFGAPTGWFGFDLSLMSDETLGIGIAYIVIILIILFLLMGFAYIAAKDNRKKHYMN